MQASRYWSGTEYAPDPNDASLFGTFIGLQSNGNKGLQVYGWAVRPGQVAAAPLPGTALLMALGSLGFGAGRWARRRLWSFGPSGHSVLSRGVRGGDFPLLARSASD